jgi:hypothetical protein
MFYIFHSHHVDSLAGRHIQRWTWIHTNVARCAEPQLDSIALQEIGDPALLTNQFSGYTLIFCPGPSHHQANVDLLLPFRRYFCSHTGHLVGVVEHSQTLTSHCHGRSQRNHKQPCISMPTSRCYSVTRVHIFAGWYDPQIGLTTFGSKALLWYYEQVGDIHHNRWSIITVCCGLSWVYIHDRAATLWRELAMAVSLLPSILRQSLHRGYNTNTHIQFSTVSHRYEVHRGVCKYICMWMWLTWSELPCWTEFELTTNMTEAQQRWGEGMRQTTKRYDMTYDVYAYAYVCHRQWVSSSLWVRCGQTLYSNVLVCMWVCMCVYVAVLTCCMC